MHALQINTFNNINNKIERYQGCNENLASISCNHGLKTKNLATICRGIGYPCNSISLDVEEQKTHSLIMGAL
jgi:hypothetical protein